MFVFDTLSSQLTFNFSLLSPINPKLIEIINHYAPESTRVCLHFSSICNVVIEKMDKIFSDVLEILKNIKIFNFIFFVYYKFLTGALFEL